MTRRALRVAGLVIAVAVVVTISAVAAATRSSERPPADGDAPTRPADRSAGRDEGPLRLADGSTCDHEIPLDMAEADGATNMSAVEPGDLVCLRAGPRGALELRNFQGRGDAVITFANVGGVVDIRGSDDDYAGIEIEDSERIRVTGTGTSSTCGAGHAEDAQRCGVRVRGSQRAVTGRVRTEHVEIDHVEMGETTQAAVNIKDNELARGEWIADDIVLRHNYLHDIDHEGMYIGSSYYESGDYHTVHSVEISDNLVVRTGRDGIQVGSATAYCEIRDNVIADTGLSGERAHGAGVMNNKGSVCDVHGNRVADTAGWGIFVQGNGTNEIYNNVVARSGRAVGAGDHDGDGIAVRDGSNDGDGIYVWNNTIVSPAGDGIGWSSRADRGSQAHNNLVVDAGGTGIATPDHVDASHNLTASDTGAAGFADPADDDYRLRPDSPAVDAGAGLQDDGVVADIDGVRRPQGAAYDVGAYEAAS